MARKNDEQEYVEAIRQNRKSQTLDFQDFMIKPDTAGRKLEEVRMTLSERLERPATLGEAQRMYKSAQALESIARSFDRDKSPSLDFSVIPDSKASEQEGEEPVWLTEEEIEYLVDHIRPYNSPPVGCSTHINPSQGPPKSSGSSGSQRKTKALKVDWY